MAEAGAGQDAGQQDRGVVLPNYDSLTVEQRRQWCDFLIAKPLADAGKAPFKIFDGNPLDDPNRHYNLHEVRSINSEYKTALNTVLNTLASGSKRKIEDTIYENAFVLGHQYKFHIQPDPSQRLQAVRDLGFLLAQNDDLHAAVGEIKVRTDHVDQLHGSIYLPPEPFITIYGYPNNDIAKIEKPLCETFKSYIPTALLDHPRFNVERGEVVFFSQGDGKLKSRLKRERMLDRYYDPKTSYSSLRDKIQYRIPSLGAQIISGKRFKKIDT